MQRRSRQQAYDRGTTVFSPDGHLYQVEYAREAVERGATTVGVKTRDGVVLAAKRRVTSPLQVSESVEKLHEADDHVGIASTGHVADGRALIDLARRRAQANRLRYGEAIDVESLTKALTDHIQEYTQRGGARPFGASLLVGGVSRGRPRLYATDPGGSPSAWTATAIGEGWQDVRAYLERTYADDIECGHGVAASDTIDIDTEGGIEIALAALAEVHDDLVPDEIGVGTVDTGTRQFRTRTDDEIRARMETADLDTGRWENT